MNITVYLGAFPGNDPSFELAVKELGTWIGKSHNALIYGGSKSGLMGLIAESTLLAGGEVTGVEPQFFIDSELQHDGLTRLIVTQDMEERKAKMDELTNSFEYDIVNKTPGRIWFGRYYIDCYIKDAASKVSATKNNWTDMEIGIYCPYPMWAVEETKNFFPDSADKAEQYEFLDYPYGYPYDYSRPSSGTQHWYVDHYRSSNFRMTIYGPCANPRIAIAKQIYQVYDTLETNEYIEINSRKKTIIKRLANGTEQNIFYKKATGNSVFTEIPAGDLLISWSGEFGFDITVFKERSVPEWTS